MIQYILNFNNNFFTNNYLTNLSDIYLFFNTIFLLSYFTLYNLYYKKFLISYYILVLYFIITNLLINYNIINDFIILSYTILLFIIYIYTFIQMKNYEESILNLNFQLNDLIIQRKGGYINLNENLSLTIEINKLIGNNTGKKNIKDIEIFNNDYFSIEPIKLENVKRNIDILRFKQDISFIKIIQDKEKLIYSLLSNKLNDKEINLFEYDFLIENIELIINKFKIYLYGNYVNSTYEEENIELNNSIDFFIKLYRKNFIQEDIGSN